MEDDLELYGGSIDGILELMMNSNGSYAFQVLFWVDIPR